MRYVLGIDVGGTKIASSVVDQGMRMVGLKVAETSQIDLIRQLMDLIKSEKKFDAIGLAMPGPVLADGTVIRLPNVEHFQRTNVKKLFEERFNVPVSVVNDAKAFAFAESKIGQGQNNKVVAGVILGTGMAAGIVIDQEIYFGKDGITGELEHVVLPNGHMFRELRHAAGRFKKAEDAQPFLKTIIDMVVLSFNPDVIVLGGGWSDLPGMEELASSLAINVGNYENQTPVKVSTIKYPGLLGAAILAGLNQKV